MRVYRYERRLHWSECDPGGIVFFPNYARWMVDGLNEMFLSLGIDPNGVIDEATRGGLPVLQLSMRFLSAPALHETLTHEISVQKIGSKSLAFRHRFLRNDELLMEAEETRIWATHSLGVPSVLTTLPVPANVRELLSTNP
jgi:4-hydroxybenzoyl-CoA thioesterase